MMKEKVKQWVSFMTFDLPLKTEYITSAFATNHSRRQKDIPQWSTTATRQKMIAEYWYTEVFRHYLLLLIFPILIVFLIYREFSPGFLIAIAAAIIISFPVLLLFNYWPNFSGRFLPQLETVKEIYEHKQLEYIEKCRKLQLPNCSLALIFYVFDKASGINSIDCTDQYANILVRLYGVDAGSLKGNLELLKGHSKGKKNWSDRQWSEMGNRFNEARQFFTELDFKPGVQLLDDFEIQNFRK